MNHNNAQRPAQDQERASSDLNQSSREKNNEDVQSSTDPSVINGLEDSHPDEKNIASVRSNTRPESIRSPPIKVPRSQRRGLFGRFTILAEVEEPRDYKNKTKWFITSLVSLAALAAPLGSTIIFRESSSTANPCPLSNHIWCSCACRYHKILSHHLENRQSLSRPLHAGHGDLSAVVVIFLGNFRPPHNLSDLIQSVRAVHRIDRGLDQRHNVDCSADAWRRSFGQCSRCVRFHKQINHDHK